MKNTVKKVLLFSVVAVLMACFAFCVSAAEIEETGYCGNDVEYTLYSDGKLVISGTGNMYWWLEPTFSQISENIKIVIIEEGVTSIGQWAFEWCENLTSVTLPDGITTIEPQAFQYCYNLKSINIPDSVINIGYSAFAGCISLESIHIPKNIETIDESAFSGCSALANIDFPDVFTGIEPNAFEETKWYNDQPDGVIYAGKTAFGYKGDMPANSAITLKPGTLAMNMKAFYECKNLKSIVIPETVTEIPYCAFYNCYYLEDINLHKNITSIGPGAFKNCKKLTKITLPDGVEIIESSTFDGCISLTSITGNNVSIISSDAFYNCTKLQIAIFNGTSTNESYVGSCAFYGCQSLKDVTLPENISYVYSSAFKGCASLTTIVFRSAAGFSHYCFEGCDNLTDIYYGGSEEEWDDCCNSDFIHSSVKVHYAYVTHDHNYEVVESVSATCMNGGVKVYECSICGMKKTETSGKVSHSYGKTYTVDKAATCAQTGSKSKHCIYKGCSSKTDIVSIPKTAHTNKTIKAVVATCEKNGSTEKIICSKCNYVIKAASVISATGHSFKTVTTKASPTKDGKTESKCSKCNKVDTSKIIYKASYINLSETSYIYNGKVRKPYVYVNASNRTYLVKGRDYTVTFSDNKSKTPGKYKVTITFIGNYTGSKVLEYTISPKDTSIKSLAAGPSAITVNWSKQTSQTTGYEIQYSVKKNFKSAKTVTVKKNKTVSKKITGLKGKTKYYVRIRTYKTVGKTKLYSEWSSVKSVTTKPNTGVILNTTAVTLYTGGTKTVKASVYPSGTKIKWSTDKKSVATVSGGKIKAVKKGKAVITASFKYKGKTYKATCKVTVKNPTLKLNKTSLALDEGKSATLKATATPACTVTWKTSDKTVATVSKNGKVKAVGYGTAKITAKITYGGKTYSKSCKVTVNETCDHVFYDYYDTDVEPTCTKPGYESRYCAYCDEKTGTRQIKAKGHSFGDWVITVAATPQKEGVKTRTCSRCKHKETKAVVTGEMYSRPLSGQSGQVITVGPRKMKITVTKVLAGAEANSLAVSEYSYNKGHGNGKEWRIYFFDVEYISSENGYGDILKGSDIINDFGDCVYTSKGVSVSTSKYAVFGGKYRGQSNLDLKLVPGSSGKMVFGFLTDTGLGDLVLRLATNVYYTTDPVTWLSLAPPSASVAPDIPGSSTGKNAEENLTALKQYILENGEVAAQGKTRRLTKEFSKNGYEYFAFLSYNISEDSIWFSITSDSGSGIPDTISFTMKNATSPLTVTSYLYDYSGYIIGNSTGTISLTPSAYSIPSDYSFNWTTVYKNPGAPGSYDPYNSIAGTNGSKRATSLLDLGFATWNSMILEATGMGMDNIGFTSY